MAKTATNLGPVDLSSDISPLDKHISLLILIFFHIFLSGNACNR